MNFPVNSIYRAVGPLYFCGKSEKIPVAGINCMWVRFFLVALSIVVQRPGRPPPRS